MKSLDIGTPIRTIALTALFAVGVATGVAVSASASPSQPQPCTADVQGQQAAPTVAATSPSYWSVPPAPRGPGSTPY